MKRIAIACALFVIVALLGCSLLGSDPPENPNDVISAVTGEIEGYVTDACTNENKEAALKRAVDIENISKVWKRRLVAACSLLESASETASKYCVDIKVLLSVLENEKERLMQIHNRVCDDP